MVEFADNEEQIFQQTVEWLSKKLCCVPSIITEQNYEFTIDPFTRTFIKSSEGEKEYVENSASVDFILYSKFDKQPVLGIEVDDYQFHENNPPQSVKDNLKDNNIFNKYNIPLLRLKQIVQMKKKKSNIFLSNLLISLICIIMY